MYREGIFDKVMSANKVFLAKERCDIDFPKLAGQGWLARQGLESY
jgi:hypothetical protein